MGSEFWNGKTVFVSGAGGFLGGWLVDRLVASGSKVVALVRSMNQESQFFLRSLDSLASVEHGDVADRAFVDGIFRRYPIDVFFHTAAVSDINRVLQEPLACFNSTALSTWQILDFIRRESPKCVSVISSTDKVYGRQALPYREGYPLLPLHPYETAKASQDLAAQSYGKVYGSAVGVTRCGNYFGGYDFNFDRLIPGVVRSIVAGESPMLRSNGKFTRDFLYIEDAADVQLLLAEQLATRPELHGEPFNFSYGTQIEVIDIVRSICSIMGSSMRPEILDNAFIEIPHQQLSSDKAREMLGWRPAIGFDEGLARTVRWYADYFTKKISV